jgi:hypothetical protein
VDHQVKVRGFRIELGEIEANLLTYPGVKAAVALVREDTLGERRLVAYVTGPERGTPTASELRRHLRKNLPEYMLPTAFMVLKDLPLTPNGKVDKRALPAPDWGVGAGVRYIAPRTAIDKTIASVWCDVLGVQKVGLNDNFFELGGNSLLLIRVESELRLRLRRQIPLIEFFRRPTVVDLAAYLHEGQAATLTFDKLKDRAEQQKKALRPHGGRSRGRT